MPRVQDAPIREPIADQNGIVRPVWIKWFASLIRGDNGLANYTPTFSGITFTGAAPTIIANYYQNQGFTDFWITITPSSGNSTSSTAGTTYFQLPVNVTHDTHCSAVNGTTNAALGVVQASTDRIYPPNWTTVTVPGDN